MTHSDSEKRLLVFNCHEAWVHQLGVLGVGLDIVVGLHGQSGNKWDTRMRPVPQHGRLVQLEEALRSQTQYYCIIAHNISDLLDVKHRPEPRLVVIHSTLEGRRLEENSAVEPSQMRGVLHKYLELIGGHAMAVSVLKGASWGFTDDIVPFFADPADYYEYSGEHACGLRICNHISSRRRILMWDFHEQAFGGLPVKLVGHNPDMTNVHATESWDDLKRTFANSRFYIHTADPALEDGYNMATLEAMAAGLPVLGNAHPGSPVVHGESGFLSNDAEELREYARKLLADRELARRMGENARQTVREKFSKDRFRSGLLASIERARAKSLGRRVAI